MKRFLSVFAVVCLLLSACFALASCDGIPFIGGDTDADETEGVTYSWSGLMSEYRELMEEYKLALKKYEQNPSDLEAYEEKARLSMELNKIAGELLVIMDELSAKEESGSKEAGKELRAFLTEMNSINEILIESET